MLHYYTITLPSAQVGPYGWVGGDYDVADTGARSSGWWAADAWGSGGGSGACSRHWDTSAAGPPIAAAWPMANMAAAAQGLRFMPGARAAIAGSVSRATGFQLVASPPVDLHIPNTPRGPATCSLPSGTLILPFVGYADAVATTAIAAIPVVYDIASSSSGSWMPRMPAAVVLEPQCGPEAHAVGLPGPITGPDAPRGLPVAQAAEADAAEDDGVTDLDRLIDMLFPVDYAECGDDVEAPEAERRIRRMMMTKPTSTG
jgi:hypothetical protein